MPVPQQPVRARFPSFCPLCGAPIAIAGTMLNHKLEAHNIAQLPTGEYVHYACYKAHTFGGSWPTPDDLFNDRKVNNGGW